LTLGGCAGFLLGILAVSKSGNRENTSLMSFASNEKFKIELPSFRYNFKKKQTVIEILKINF